VVSRRRRDGSSSSAPAVSTPPGWACATPTGAALGRRSERPARFVSCAQAEGSRAAPAGSRPAPRALRSCASRSAALTGRPPAGDKQVRTHARVETRFRSRAHQAHDVVAGCVRGCREKRCPRGHLTTALRTDSLCNSRAASHDRIRLICTSARASDCSYLTPKRRLSGFTRQPFPGPATRVGRFGMRLLSALLVERRRYRRRPRDRDRGKAIPVAMIIKGAPGPQANRERSVAKRAPLSLTGRDR